MAIDGKTEVTCGKCKRVLEIPTVHAPAWCGTCPQCVASCYDAFALQRSVETFDWLNDRHKLVIGIDPQRDIVDSWTDDDFPNHNAASSDDASAETRVGTRVDDAESREGSRDANELDASARTVLHDGSRLNLEAPCESKGACASSAGAGESPAPALSPSDDGAAHHAASSFAVCAGDLSSAALCPLGSSPSRVDVSPSSNVISLSSTSLITLRRKVQKWLSGAEVAS